MSLHNKTNTNNMQYVWCFCLDNFICVLGKVSNETETSTNIKKYNLADQCNVFENKMYLSQNRKH